MPNGHFPHCSVQWSDSVRTIHTHIHTYSKTFRITWSSRGLAQTTNPRVHKSTALDAHTPTRPLGQQRLALSRAQRRPIHQFVFGPRRQTHGSFRPHAMAFRGSPRRQLDEGGILVHLPNLRFCGSVMTQKSFGLGYAATAPYANSDAWSASKTTRHVPLTALEFSAA